MNQGGSRRSFCIFAFWGFYYLNYLFQTICRSPIGRNYLWTKRAFFCRSLMVHRSKRGPFRLVPVNIRSSSSRSSFGFLFYYVRNVLRCLFFFALGMWMPRPIITAACQFPSYLRLVPKASSGHAPLSIVYFISTSKE